MRQYQEYFTQEIMDKSEKFKKFTIATTSITLITSAIVSFLSVGGLIAMRHAPPRQKLMYRIMAFFALAILAYSIYGVIEFEIQTTRKNIDMSYLVIAGLNMLTTLMLAFFLAGVVRGENGMIPGGITVVALAASFITPIFYIKTYA